jgi:hypothetical protein
MRAVLSFMCLRVIALCTESLIRSLSLSLSLYLSLSLSLFLLSLSSCYSPLCAATRGRATRDLAPDERGRRARAPRAVARRGAERRAARPRGVRAKAGVQRAGDCLSEPRDHRVAAERVAGRRALCDGDGGRNGHCLVGARLPPDGARVGTHGAFAFYFVSTCFDLTMESLHVHGF